MSNIENLIGDPFVATEADGITVIDFYADWCGPCRVMTPQFEHAARLRPDYRFAKVDVDAEPALAARYGVRSIPTLIILKDGVPVAGQAGIVPARALVGAADRIAGADAPAGATVVA